VGWKAPSSPTVSICTQKCTQIAILGNTHKIGSIHEACRTTNAAKWNKRHGRPSIPLANRAIPADFEKISLGGSRANWSIPHKHRRQRAIESEATRIHGCDVAAVAGRPNP
jgi:hypothetical protein